MKIGSTGGCRFAQMFMRQVNSTNSLYGKYLDIDFLPWGRTTRHANGTLICQFGEADCWANRVQRCALSLLSGNQDAQVRYMLCEYSDPLPALEQRSLACAAAVGLKIIAVDYCVSTSYGDRLEGPIEERSRKGMEAIDRIPFIVFNNIVSVDLYNEVVRRGLARVVCNALLADPTTSVTAC
ncbi:jg20357 [Pararge aegeria aegeria]|uniref:Jg20357 protein n=1 Tax=Pararge aegeria aegeria TaxID=348720 RepID=A0A8S4RB45_9NEOP|nr:jg20357 [Pararge aegeria aegeria]